MTKQNRKIDNDLREIFASVKNDEKMEREMDAHAQNFVNSLRKIKPNKSFDESLRKI